MSADAPLAGLAIEVVFLSADRDSARYPGLCGHDRGEQFTITVAGRPVATLGPARRRRWVSGADLARIWDTPAPRTLAEDLERFPAELADPFA